MKYLKSSAATTLALLAAVAVVSTALLIVGCGGSGQSSTSNTSPSPIPSNLGTPRIEAIVLVSTQNLMNPSAFTQAQLLDPTNLTVKADLINPTVFGFQDMTNFQVGEDYVFQLVAYGPTSKSNPYGRVILPATFTSSDTAGTYGTLADNSGVFLASQNATTQPLTIYASYNGQSYTNLYNIKPRQARVLGTVAVQPASGQTSSAPVSGALLDFYDANGNLTGSVTSAIDGSFRASLPTATVTFTVDPHSLAAGFYGLFALGNAPNLTYFNAGDPACRATITSANSGVALVDGTQTMSTIYTVPTTVTTEPTPSCG